MKPRITHKYTQKAAADRNSCRKAMRARTALLPLTCSLAATAYLGPRGRIAPRSVRLALSSLERAIAGNDVDAVVDSLDDATVPCDRALAVAALDKAAAVTPDSSDGEQFVALRARGHAITGFDNAHPML